MTMPNLPNLAPTGVVQTPGIGVGLGQGLSQLAQILQAKQQMAQQQAYQQAELGQGQQRIDLDKAQQLYAQQRQQQQDQLATAQQAATQADQSAFGGAIQAMQPQQQIIPGMQMTVPGQLGTADMPGFSTPSTTTVRTPTFVDATGKMDPGQVARFIASPQYKAWLETQKQQMDSHEVIGIGDTPVFKYSGQTAGPTLKAQKNPDPAEIVLGQMGLPIDTTGPQLAAMGRLGEYNDMMAKHWKQAVPQPTIPQKAESAFSVKFGEKTADNLTTLQPVLAQQARALPTLDQMDTILSAGKLNAGALGPMYQALGQAAVSMGWATPETVEKVQNTQFYGNLVAKMMAATVKEFSSRGLTQGDIPFVEAANAANKTWTIGGLQDAVRFEAKMIRENAANFNETLNKIPATDVNPTLTGLSHIDLSGNRPRTMHFLVNGQDVLGTLDDRTGRYIGVVNGQQGYVDGRP